jgi:hypothetical protein
LNKKNQSPRIDEGRFGSYEWLTIVEYRWNVKPNTSDEARERRRWERGKASRIKYLLSIQPAGNKED